MLNGRDNSNWGAEMKRTHDDEPGCSYSGHSHRLELLSRRGEKEKESEHDPSQPCHIDKVPDEVLARIIRLLPCRDRIASGERVSRRWRRMVQDGKWSDFTVFDSREWWPLKSKGKKIKPNVCHSDPMSSHVQPLTALIFSLFT